MKVIVVISRIFAGLVFVFSGFVKAVDPAGFAIKFEEYFMAFHLDILINMALPLAVLMSAAEMMIGLNLLIGVRMKFTAWLLIIFMSCFTTLTLILALTNPVSDCGCFGDALILTNWQTFGKNIILFIPALIVFINRDKCHPFSTSFVEWTLAGVNFLFPVLLSVYCLIHQPIIDFRPYKPGTHIPEKMSFPDGAATAVYETLLVYEKNGQQQVFSERSYPWQDTTWKWVETKQTLISKGYEPPIHDFSITNAEGNDITEQVLTDSNYVFLIISPKLANASIKGMRRMNDLAMKANNLGFKTYCLTASTNSQIEDFNNSFQPVFEFCTTDETTLKTIVRANPGILILQVGTILGKWNFRDAPAVHEINSNLIATLLERHRCTTEISTVLLLGFAVILFYCLIWHFIPTRPVNPE
jgi:uncharacterized membrane protein YphA (DoxX/SURF4 family)